MDYSSLTEAQQQAQAQQHYQIQQQQQQQQQQALYAQPTDPNQAYAQPNQSYYPHYQPYPQLQNPQPQNTQQYYQPQQYPYYQQEYAAPAAIPAAAVAPPAAYQAHSDANLQPPGLDHPSHSQPPPAAALPQQNAYYPQPGMEQQQHGSYPGGPRLTPAAAAAAAALSQLSQLAGSVDAAGRAMAAGYQDPWHGKKGQMGKQTVIAAGNNGPMLTIGGSPSPFRGGGRRGRAPFRGGGRRGFNNRHSGPETSAPPAFRGRGGRMGGRGGGRRNPPPPAPEPGTTPSWKAPKVAWCPLCHVDCNTDEILQQHFNGKRHKKNLQKAEEDQAWNKRKATFDSQQKRMDQSQQLQPKLVDQSQQLQPKLADQSQQLQPKLVDQFQQLQPKLVDQPDNVQEAEDKKASESESVPAGTGTSETKTETEQVEQLEKPKEEPTEVLGQNPRAGNFTARNRYSKKRPAKRNFTDFRRGKRYKSSAREGPAQPPQPHQLPPQHRVCALCNVTCESQVVLEAHLAGKKHAFRAMRYHGQEVVFGSADLQAFLMSQPPPTVIMPQGQQTAVYVHQSQQTVPYADMGQNVVPEPQMQQAVYGNEGAQAGQEDQVLPTGYGHDVQQEPQEQQMILESVNQQAATEPEGQQTIPVVEGDVVLGSASDQVHAPDTVGPIAASSAPADSDHVFPAPDTVGPIAASSAPADSDHVFPAPDTVGPIAASSAPADSDNVFPATEDAVSGPEYVAVTGLEIKPEDTIFNIEVPPTVTEEIIE